MDAEETGKESVLKVESGQGATATAPVSQEDLVEASLRWLKAEDTKGDLTPVRVQELETGGN